MLIKEIRKDIIGNNEFLHGPYGKKLITYADYTASGRAVYSVEKKLHNIQLTYANTHSTDNCTGQATTYYYNEAKKRILDLLKGNKNYVVLPCGSGSTEAICRLQQILGIYEAPKNKKLKDFLEYNAIKELGIDNCTDKLNEINNFIHSHRPVVFITSYEHHSNEVTWREGFCEVVKIGMTKDGLFDLKHLNELLSSPQYYNRLLIGSFSAASNVTGIKTPVHKIAKLMHEYGGYAFFDYASSGPYVDIDLTRDENSYLDGIYLSPHKFLGGPGSSGLLIFKKDIYDFNVAPTRAGGGTLEYVGPNSQIYSNSISDREDAGTKAILQLIKASLALELKQNIGVKEMSIIENSHLKKAISSLSENKNIQILGPKTIEDRIAIISFNIKHKSGFFHHKYISKLLNDLFGIQTRAGCACAGPYGHYLLKINKKLSQRYEEVIQQGINVMKPGWVRINLHYTFTKDEIDFILNAIHFVANNAHKFIGDYYVNEYTGTWINKNDVTEHNYHNPKLTTSKVFTHLIFSKKHFYRSYLKKAQSLADAKKENTLELYGLVKHFDLAWFYVEESNILAALNLYTTNTVNVDKNSYHFRT